MPRPPTTGSILEGVAGWLLALSHETPVGRLWQVLFWPRAGKPLGSRLAAGVETRPRSHYGGGWAGDKWGPQSKPGGPWQWRNETQPNLITSVPRELLLVVPPPLNQLSLKHQQAE